MWIILLVTGNNIEETKHAKDTLRQSFKLKDLGELRYFLGIEFAISAKDILISQRNMLFR